jgi:hypothetical protein
MRRVAGVLLVLVALVPAAAAAQPPPVVRLRWDLTPADRGDLPRTRVVLVVEGATTGTIDAGVVDGGCEEEDLSAPPELRPRALRTPRGVRTIAALLCYYGGYGWYVRAELSRTTLRVRRFGMAEALPDNENPPAEHVRRIGRLSVPANADFRVAPLSSPAPPAAIAEACDRAFRCCSAYVQAVGGGISVQSACNGIDAARTAPTGAEACRLMVTTWRQSLEQMRRPIPAACR